MPNQNEIRQAITNQIIAALESGSVPPLRRPWRLGKNAGAPANVVSKRSYRGLNPILLALHAEKHQLTSKWYGTFNQWKALGGRVMRRPDTVPQGQWGCQICFWTPVTKTVRTEEGDEVTSQKPGGKRQSCKDTGLSHYAALASCRALVV